MTVMSSVMTPVATVPAPSIAPARDIRYLSFALRGFLESCEQQFCAQWPLRTPGVPRHWAEGAIEYRTQRNLAY
jgi:hypothetical protein